MTPMALGAKQAWTAMLFGEQNQQTVNYLANQFQTAKDYIVGAGNSFFDRARSMFTMNNGTEAIEFARKVISKVDNNYQSDRVQPLITLEQLQTAAPTMQRWIMAEPNIRARYLKQTCAGYCETYQDHGTGVGETHYDYRMVMTGIIQEVGDGWVAKQFYDELEPHDRPLTFGEKRDILTTWAAVAGYCEDGIDDPTSVGGKF